eukprot:SAG11_NODE_2831_length_2928_cov_2.756805_1_plen_693_part_00
MESDSALPATQNCATPYMDSHRRCQPDSEAQASAVACAGRRCFEPRSAPTASLHRVIDRNLSICRRNGAYYDFNGDNSDACPLTAALDTLPGVGYEQHTIDATAGSDIWSDREDSDASTSESDGSYHEDALMCCSSVDWNESESDIVSLPVADIELTHNASSSSTGGGSRSSSDAPRLSALPTAWQEACGDTLSIGHAVALLRQEPGVVCGRTLDARPGTLELDENGELKPEQLLFVERASATRHKIRAEGIRTGIPSDVWRNHGGKHAVKQEKLPPSLQSPGETVLARRYGKIICHDQNSCEWELYYHQYVVGQADDVRDLKSAKCRGYDPLALYHVLPRVGRKNLTGGKMQKRRKRTAIVAAPAPAAAPATDLAKRLLNVCGKVKTHTALEPAYRKDVDVASPGQNWDAMVPGAELSAVGGGQFADRHWALKIGLPSGTEKQHVTQDKDEDIDAWLSGVQCKNKRQRAALVLLGSMCFVCWAFGVGVSDHSAESTPLSSRDAGCIANPCENGGSCDHGDSSRAYSCSCTSQYYGVHCEVPRRNGTAMAEQPEPEPGAEPAADQNSNPNPCAASPCLNGATCSVVSGQADRVSSPCLNGASCAAYGDTYSCHCTVGHVGTNCEVEQNAADDRLICIEYLQNATVSRFDFAKCCTRQDPDKNCWPGSVNMQMCCSKILPDHTIPLGIKHIKS